MLDLAFLFNPPPIDVLHTHEVAKLRLVPDMPEPQTRLASARLALAYLRELGGAAYLPLPMVTSALRRGRLHRGGGLHQERFRRLSGTRRTVRR